MALVGREHDLAQIEAAMRAAANASSVLTVEGEAGIGKSTLLAAAIAAAEASGVRVLRCCPTVAESALAYAALGDLLAPVTDLDAVPPAPRAALERALLRGGADGDMDIDDRRVGLGCSAVWAALVSHAPLLIALDDAHWLDAASAAALQFSLRRLPPAGVLVLAARRPDEGGTALPGASMLLRPLAEDAVAAIVKRGSRDGEWRLDARAARSVVDTAAGNPLFAIELARHSATTSRHADGSVPVPRTLDEAIDRRFGTLATPVRDAVIAVSLLARPDLPTLRRLELIGAIEQAEGDGVLDTTSGRAVMAHPLFGASVLHRTTATERRAWHARLADAVADDVESARHAALAAEAPDAALAGRLSAIAAGVAGRGARESAADFAVLAARLTPPGDDELPGRLVTAAHLSFQRGDAATAQSLLEGMELLAVTGPIRVRELLVRAVMAHSSIGSRVARAHGIEALQSCTTDAERVEVHTILGHVSYDHFPTAAEHAAIALDLAEHADVSPGVLASALHAYGGTRMMTGLGLDRSVYERAIALEADDVFAPDGAYGSLAVLLKVTDELDEAREMLLHMLRVNDDEGALPYVLSHLPQLELWSGNWDAAEDYAQRHLEAAVHTGQDDQVAQARANLGFIAVYRGDVRSAATCAEEILRFGRESGDLWTERSGIGLLALVALAEGDAERAVRLLTDWHALAVQMGLGEPGYSRLQADYVEALVATGRVDEADVYASMMEADAERLDRRSLQASASRARALVRAASGDRAAAIASATEAVAHAAATPLVVEHARALLTLGQIHRRYKEKAAAREALEKALAVFDRLGAEGLAGRARQDLARIGLRPPAGGGLTETERRVAELAGRGRTVRQVGDELFISPKTVESNLTRVYRKLGISGRAELAVWLVGQGTADP